MSAGDGAILDRLYLDDSAQAAMQWLWTNMRHLRQDLFCSVGAVNYVAIHASKRFAHPAEGYQMTAEDASFFAMAQEFCEANGHQFGDESQGINPLILQALLVIARRLLEEWLSNQDE